MEAHQASLRPPSDEDTGPPKALFLDEDWYEREMEDLFRPRWLLAGHVSEISQPGRCLTYSFGKDEAIIRMDEQGEVHAYHNVCVHRGARLCRERVGKMSKRRIVCPYHGWSYSVGDGSLMTAPSMHADFDPSHWSLRPVHVEAWCGLIFVCFADERPTSVAEHMGDRDLGGYDPTHLKVATSKSHLIKANWKVVHENNLECYHCALNHPELLTALDWRATGTDDFDGVVGARADGIEVQQRTSRWTMSYNEERVSRILLPRYDNASDPETYHLKWEPGFAIVVARDHGYMFAPRPLGPGLTELRQYWLVAAAAEEGTDYQLEPLTHYLDVTMLQDRELCERVQEGLEMPAYVPGPLNRVYQSGQAGFYAWYMDQMRHALSR